MPSKKTPPKKQDPQVTVAHLDDVGIYLGVKSIPLSALTDGHFEVPADCDLQPGRYVFNAAHKRFDPLLDDQVRLTPDAVTGDQVLAALVVWAKGQGAIDPVFDKFLAQFKTSMDNNFGRGV